MTEDELVQHLRRVANDAEPVPDAVVEAARAAIAFRTIDAELAAMIGDSADPGGSERAFELVRTDSATGERVLSFAGGGLQIDLAAGGGVLMGQVSGGPVGRCVLDADGGLREATVDDLGRFVLPVEPRGPWRLRCERRAGGWVTTAWVT
jgi:hypothetical protein